jgi:hypothetical protein
VLIEVHDESQVTERRYFSESSMAKIYETDNDGNPKEVGTTARNCSPASNQRKLR